MAFSSCGKAFRLPRRNPMNAWKVVRSGTIGCGRATPAAFLGALVILSSGAPASDPMFSRAKLTADRLCFDSPMNVDWQALARQEFDLFPLEEGPPLEQLAARANLT